MKIEVDRNVYSDACISKAIYALSGSYVITRTLEGHVEVLNVECLKENSDETIIRHQLFSVLNDYKLRQIVEDETHDIRVILYAKAFADCDDLEDV